MAGQTKSGWSPEDIGKGTGKRREKSKGTDALYHVVQFFVSYQSQVLTLSRQAFYCVYGSVGSLYAPISYNHRLARDRAGDEVEACIEK